MARSPGRQQIRQVSVIRFRDLPPDIQRDFAVCMKDRLERILGVQESIFSDNVLELLLGANQELPLLMVKTEALTRFEREINEDVVLEYMQIWESGQAHFPPVVIDTESDELLCEGGHRSFSAFHSGIAEIEAVDVSALDPEPLIRSLPRVYRVTLTPEAERQYGDLNKGVQRKIDEVFERLRGWPQVSGVIPLWGAAKGHFRIKTMDWRVIFHVDEGAQTVLVDSISHRKDAYDKFHGQSRKG